jgi:hypothetical protein
MVAFPLSLPHLERARCQVGVNYRLLVRCCEILPKLRKVPNRWVRARCACIAAGPARNEQMMRACRRHRARQGGASLAYSCFFLLELPVKPARRGEKKVRAVKIPPLDGLLPIISFYALPMSVGVISLETLSRML